ncbi:multiple RNA-binding domain-containing protein 1 [Geosmithia morbida]|uniref:Multiple RNA-binding domain-containing protein 1 n=1 Tax=Geosmithia morbida TaxID=1094350 RepID=A0A9P4YYC5_9HYPO|nr:multiple RNA-binding domain-containing protein 1 [Geosmithia morbida]KAF4125145.1 multiple RNA-binding domain-containing protein 1 [Geosmithia morbida]
METSRIFIKGLPTSLTEAEARKHFSAGNRDITDIKLIPQRRIGYIGYKSAEDAAKAVKYFNKSFVRMSRISVEPAKAISDPTLNRQRQGNFRSAISPVKRRPDGEVAGADEPSVSKKRKIDAPSSQSSDPKLREYLRVIGKSREEVLADTLDSSSNIHVTADGETLPGAVPQAAIPEGDSDGEYEQIPTEKARMKPNKPAETVSKAATPSSSVARPPQTAVAGEARRQMSAAAAGGKFGHDDATAAASTESDEGQEVKQDTAMTVDETTAPSAPAPAATDDDWLRSRTNRLLDLMDPDDIVPQPASGNADAQTSQPPPRSGGDGESSEDKVGRETVDTSGDNAPGAINQGAQLGEPTGHTTVDAIRQTSRLFVRNLPFGATEDEIRESFGKFGTIEEVHIPVSRTGASKGFAMILFADASRAVEAFQSMDGTTFQGRILHIIPGSAKRDSGLDEFELSKLPLKKQNLIRKRQEAASSTFNWNSLFMNQDAVNASVASRLGVSKSELLDPTSADAAVRQAVAETTVIQETKAYFVSNGVDLEAFRTNKRGDTAILVKNFPYGTSMDEIRTLFEQAGGPVLRVLMPPSGTIAIVQFAQANDAKSAFGKLAYRRIKDSVLFLEKAPKDLLKDGSGGVVPSQSRTGGYGSATGAQKLDVDDLLSSADRADEVVDTTSLFVRNLNFDTSTDRLAEAFSSLDGFVSARVKTKNDAKKPGKTLSMGFGFVEFRTKAQAHEALKMMDGHVLDGHTLAVKASHRGLDAAEERRREDKAKRAAGQRTKLVIKNLPFQTTKNDIRTLFGTYGQLRSVRVPKKADHTARGFAFADFVTPREAENALNSLRDTHILGRKLVIDFAEAEAADAEEEIEKMQRKVGGQANKMALQKLTGGGRQKVTIGDEEEGEEGL